MPRYYYYLMGARKPEPVTDGVDGPEGPRSVGELLSESFMRPMGLTQYRLAKEIGVPAQRIGDILLNKRGITADTDLRLCKLFDLPKGYWLQMQTSFDLARAERAIGSQLERIRPWPDPWKRRSGILAR